MRSLFVLDLLDMKAEIPGGVQLCSQEFLKIVQAASHSVDYCEVSVCRRLLWRLRRRLHLGSYLLYHPEEARLVFLQKIQHNQPTHVFLNRSELLRLTPLLRDLLPDAQIILMSHGNQSGDDLYELAGQGGSRNQGFARLIALWQIGQDLGTESWFRHRYVDAVCVMSEEEETIERWLGAKSTITLPRTIHIDSLSCTPQPGRIGFVGTLNHTPNRVALEQICKELSRQHPKDIELRLVGRPESFGQGLAKQFEFVSYLGPLDEAALKTEVSTWNLFLNPIFCLSRGASMKLGKAISWGIPFLTTRSGTRGYQLTNAGLLTTSDNSHEFVVRLLELVNNSNYLDEAKQIVRLNQLNSPTIEDLAARLSCALRKLSPSPKMSI